MKERDYKINWQVFHLFQQNGVFLSWWLDLLRIHHCFTILFLIHVQERFYLFLIYYRTNTQILREWIIINYDNCWFVFLDVFTQISGTNGLLVVSKLDIYLRDLLQVSIIFFVLLKVNNKDNRTRSRTCS